jgi:uncharacterized glyoxalase superfamily protein PhnB
VDLTSRIVVTDANAAAAWYAHGFGAEERSRVATSGRRRDERRARHRRLDPHVASEFADAGILSPLTIGDGTSLQRVLQRSAHGEGLSAVPNWVLR